MNGDSPFHYSRTKLYRAIELIADLETRIEEYKRDPPITIETSSKIGEPIALAKLAPPTFTMAILGDIFHNLRSPLDLLASDLVRLSGKNHRGVAFPFANSLAELPRQIRDKKFDRAGDDAVQLLIEFAPYSGGNIALRGLHDMNRLDKHETVITTINTTALQISVLFKPSTREVKSAKATIDPNSFRAVFPDGTAFEGEEVIPTLKNLVQLVDGIIEAFERLIELRAKAS